MRKLPEPKPGEPLAPAALVMPAPRGDGSIEDAPALAPAQPVAPPRPAFVVPLARERCRAHNAFEADAWFGLSEPEDTVTRAY